MLQKELSKKSNIELLRELGNIELPLTPDSYWEKENIIIENYSEKNKKLYDSIIMTHDTYIKKFDI